MNSEMLITSLLAGTGLIALLAGKVGLLSRLIAVISKNERVRRFSDYSWYVCGAFLVVWVAGMAVVSN